MKILAEARCPIQFYEEYLMNKMTKQEIIDQLKLYGIDATLRPRKATLLALLKEKEDESTIYEPLPVSTEEWMNFTKVEADRSNQIWVGLFLFLLGALIVYAWELGISFPEMLGVFLVFMFNIGGVFAIYKCYNGLGLDKKGN